MFFSAQFQFFSPGKTDKKGDLVNGYIQFRKICFKIAKNTL